MTAPVQNDSRSSLIKTVLMIVVPLISGGAMGAFINHYYSNVQTIVTYSVITTSLGAGQTTKSVLPDLKLLMGNVELPAVYTHTIEFKHSGGPELDRATVGVSVAGAHQPKLLGNVLPSSPDPVHRISCQGFDQSTQSVTCTSGRSARTLILIELSSRRTNLPTFLWLLKQRTHESSGRRDPHKRKAARALRRYLGF
jgi:hypothetical protein